jgi:hypothetical protein
MFNQNKHSIETQIRIDLHENYCEMADITMSQIQNNVYLIQINNNYANQDLKIESENCGITLLEKEIINETDVNGGDLGIKLIHYDYKIVLRRQDGYVKFTCPTFKGEEPIVTWFYRDESWALTDFDKNIQIIKHS